MADRSCAQCGRAESSPSAHKPCSRCKVAFYCSTACQAKHWKAGGHKQNCRKLQQQRQQPQQQEQQPSSPWTYNSSPAYKPSAEFAASMIPLWVPPGSSRAVRLVGRRLVLQRSVHSARCELSGEPLYGEFPGTVHAPQLRVELLRPDGDYQCAPLDLFLLGPVLLDRADRTEFEHKLRHHARHFCHWPGIEAALSCPLCRRAFLSGDSGEGGEVHVLAVQMLFGIGQRKFAIGSRPLPRIICSKCCSRVRRKVVYPVDVTFNL